MIWRRLQPGELDHESLWLAVSLAGLGFAWLWLWSGFPTPGCPFHLLTGWPCPTCGATRCVRYALAGAWGAAWLANPMIFCAGIAAVVFDAYAAAVLTLRLKRWRIDRISPKSAGALRVIAVAVLLADWLWLVRTGA